MPLSPRTYRDGTVLPYVWGLLPEDLAARRAVASELGVSPNNPFALLETMGLDCPGAVQFCPVGENPNKREKLTKIDDATIARRLAQGRIEGSGWLAVNEHWSLGGQQAKFALRSKDGKWYSCGGSAATTHIFKSGVQGLAHQALNEFVCLKLAAACGIRAANVEYREFPGETGLEPAIIVERYDRTTIGGNVTRLHQEDLCQALGCLPGNKYTMYGGPGTADILRLLLSTGENAQANAADFLQMIFFNYLTAATDGHAKNYSIMLAADNAHRLAPLYDVASMAPYVEAAEWSRKPPRLALSIGGENRVGYVGSKQLSKLVEQCSLGQVGITADGCANLLCAYAQMIPEKLSEIFDSLSTALCGPASEDLRQHMEPPIVAICDRAVARLS